MALSTPTVLTDSVEKQDEVSASWEANSSDAGLDAVHAGGPVVILASSDPLNSREATRGDEVSHDSLDGLVTALQSLSGDCKLVWVARGGAGAPFEGMVNRCDSPDASLASPRVRLRHVSLTPQEEDDYYGLCYEGLWPLCHRTSVRPTFREQDVRTYSSVHARCVAALCAEVTTDSPVVLVHDHHLALAAKMIRGRLPLAVIAAFWDIPFPTPRALSVCPWEQELVENLLSSSILRFQTPEDCQNFLDAAVCVLGAQVDRDANTVSYEGHRTSVFVSPASIEWPHRWMLQSTPVTDCRSVVRHRFGLSPETRLIVGIDTLDYTKGLVQKFLALERLLIERPEFRGKAVLLQAAAPSLSWLSSYKNYQIFVNQTAGRINQRFATSDYQPIRLLDRHADRREVFELLRASDVCYVGSLHEGMNLVSKEFVSARDDEGGVLILSEFSGAARELGDALCVNPYASDDCAKTLAEALTMPVEEQARRMRSMRAVVQRSNAYEWAMGSLRDAAAVHARFDKSLSLGRRAVGRASTLAVTS